MKRLNPNVFNNYFKLLLPTPCNFFHLDYGVIHDGKLIDSSLSISDCKTRIDGFFSGINILYIDTEFVNNNVVCFVQLANSNNQILLFDCLNNHDVVCSYFYKNLHLSFISKKVIKVGFDLFNDIKVLSPYFDKSKVLVNFVCLQKNFSHLRNMMGKSSLLKVVFFQLGIIIDKEQQCSDWTNRPVNWYQFDYLVRDVLILAPLFLSLLMLCVEDSNTILFNNFSYTKIIEGKYKKKKKKAIDFLNNHQINYFPNNANFYIHFTIINTNRNFMLSNGSGENNNCYLLKF